MADRPAIAADIYVPMTIINLQLCSCCLPSLTHSLSTHFSSMYHTPLQFYLLGPCAPLLWAIGPMQGLLCVLSVRDPNAGLWLHSGRDEGFDRPQGVSKSLFASEAASGVLQGWGYLQMQVMVH